MREVRGARVNGEDICVEFKVVVLSFEFKFFVVFFLKYLNFSGSYGWYVLIFIFDSVDLCLFCVFENWLGGFFTEEKMWINIISLFSVEDIGW